jgi:hypothetical protein
MKTYNTALRNITKYLGNGVTGSDVLDDFGRKLFGPKFQGVFPIDEFMKKSVNNKRSYFIVNLDTSNLPGSHWIAVVILKKRKPYIYDSFGRKTREITPIRESFDAEYDPEQKKRESNCGQRSLAWLCVFDTCGKDVAMTI